MKTNEIRAARIKKGKSAKDMGTVLGVSEDSYYKKERGDVKFCINDVPLLAEEFEWTLQDVNYIFFDDKLPTG